MEAGSTNSRPDRDARREALLEAAALEFNAHGVSRASLSRIARAKGLTRAAVYYYVRDRDDLVFQAYRKSCEVTASDLAAAAVAPGDALARLSAFIRAALDPHRPPTAVLGDLDYLQQEARALIARAHGRNVDALRALVRAGVERGELRLCDDEVVAQSIIGLTAWIPLSPDWVADTDATYRARTAEALIDLLADGECADPAWTFEPPVAIRDFFPAPANPFDRAEVAEAKLEHLLMTASQVFNRRGIDGASLEDIVGALGATKGVLYHYLNNRTELVARCQERATALYERFAETADALGQTGVDKAMVGLHLLVQAHTSGLSPLIQMVGSEALPKATREALRRRNRGLQRRYQGFAELGLRDGSFRPMDLLALSQLSAGAFEWLPKWLDPADPRASAAIASEIVDLYAHGLRRR